MTITKTEGSELSIDNPIGTLQNSVVGDSDSGNCCKASHQPLQYQQQERDHVHYLSTLFAGVGSGALSSFICAPLDLIRTRMQVWGDIQQQQQQKQSSSKVSSTNASIGSPSKAFRAILKKEGPKGMFRGLGATLVTVPLFWGVYFPLYDETKDYLTHRQTFFDASAYHPGVIHCMSAISTGTVADFICNPFFVVRTRLQTQALHELTEGTFQNNNKNKPRLSMIQMARSLKKEHGMPFFWRGMTANLIGLSHCAVQFPAYEFLKGYLRERRLKQITNTNSNFVDISHTTTNNSDNTVTELLIASGMSKMTASLISYPHEVLRSRMVDSRSSESPSLIGTARKILRQEGVIGFYNGLGVTLVRVIPNCCVTFLSYELILKNSKEYFGSRSQ
mmetsp:Transcript_11490/g.29078  ORF Transcript_11490/g.29078 Transcript_11490/m.29078 type:complete len:391 (-) Transcript_11490:2326-3498(-)